MIIKEVLHGALPSQEYSKIILSQSLFGFETDF